MEENNQEDLNIFFDETIKTKEEQCGTYTLFHGLKLSFFLQCFRTPSSVISHPWVLDGVKGCANLCHYSSKLRDLMIIIIEAARCGRKIDLTFFLGGGGVWISPTQESKSFSRQHQYCAVCSLQFAHKLFSSFFIYFFLFLRDSKCSVACPDATVRCVSDGTIQSIALRYFF